MPPTAMPSVTPDALAVDLLEVEPAVGDRLHRRGGRELDVAVHAADLLLAQPGLERVEVASAAICERKPDGSKKVICAVAVRPAVMRSQNASRVTPPGATTPTPVTTVRPQAAALTRCPRARSRRLGRERAEVEDDERLLVALVARGGASR